MEVLTLKARELSESLDERKRQAEDLLRNQANQVAAWFSLGEIPVVETGTGAAPDTRPAWGALVRNNSDMPILSVRVFFHFIAANDVASEDWQPIMRGGPVNRIRVIPPRSEKLIEIPAQVKKMIADCNEDIYVVSIEFTDAAGNRWERDARGALVSR